MARSSAVQKSLAAALRPKTEDTRKFTLRRVPKFKASDAKLVAAAYAQLVAETGNPKLALETFLVALVRTTFGDMKDEVGAAEIEGHLEKVMKFIPNSGTTSTVVA